jgi:hypothetical protein
VIIGVDFDGTCVEYVGDDPSTAPTNPGAERVLKDLAKKHTLVLWSLRMGKERANAYLWFQWRGIPVSMPGTVPVPFGTMKPRFDLVIDDTSAGVPLRAGGARSSAPMIDWVELEKSLISRNIL